MTANDGKQELGIFYYKVLTLPMGLPGGSVVKNLPANAEDVSSISGSGRSPGEGNGESHRQRRLAGYDPWGCKELDTTE